MSYHLNYLIERISVGGLSLANKKGSKRAHFSRRCGNKSTVGPTVVRKEKNLGPSQRPWKYNEEKSCPEYQNVTTIILRNTGQGITFSYWGEPLQVWMTKRFGPKILREMNPSNLTRVQNKDAIMYSQFKCFVRCFMCFIWPNHILQCVVFLDPTIQAQPFVLSLGAQRNRRLL